VENKEESLMLQLKNIAMLLNSFLEGSIDRVENKVSDYLCTFTNFSVAN
jgi:hypothetical protein